MNMLFIKICFLITSIAFIPQSGSHDGIKMIHSNAFNLTGSYLQAIAVDFNDTIPNDTLFINRSEEDLPVSYFRKINTGVCIDNECRIINIIIYWTMTGRYLGFELTKGEFLSKTEHVEFNNEEYRKLHTLLSDPYSLLANFTIDELVPRKNADIDAVTSATISDVLGYIVEGAAYTTYTVWHTVYGNTRRTIIKYTEKELTAELLQLILESSNIEDQAWGLSHIQGCMKLSPVLQDILFGFIRNENIYLAERAIASISPDDLGHNSIQLRLLESFNSANPELKRLILKKLIDAPFLNGEIVKKLVLEINDYNGSLINDMLVLLTKNPINDTESLQQIAKLLEHKNNYIAQKAYLYLNGIKIQDKQIKRQIELYKSNQD